MGITLSIGLCHWMSYSVPVFVHFLLCKLTQAFLYCQKLKNCCETLVNTLFSVWHMYDPDWVSCALLHQCVCIPFASCSRRMQPVLLGMRMLLLWITSCATDQVVLTGRHLHLLPSTCHAKCACYWTFAWCLFFQQLQIRLQGKEKELENLTLQIVTEKVISFFGFSLSSLLSSSLKPQTVQKTRLIADHYLEIRWLACL